MKIETRFNIGDSVWFESFGYPKQAKVIHIKINLFADGDVIVEYHLTKSGYYWVRREERLFPTKEDCIKRIAP